jgi:cytochrome oxidase assembly protein ShyY1
MRKVAFKVAFGILLLLAFFLCFFGLAFWLRQTHKLQSWYYRDEATK